MRIGSRSNPLTVALFAGHAQGAFTLPDSLLVARDRLDTTRTAVAALRPPNAERQARAEAVQALLADPAADVAGAVLEGRHVDAEHELHAGLLREAVEYAADGVDRVDPDEILAEYLQPAHRDVLGRLRTAFEVFAPISTDPVVLWDQPTKVRQAWSAFLAAGNHYEALRGAHQAVRAGGGQQCQLDSEGLLGEVRNLDVVWPERCAGLRPVSQMTAPWPLRQDTTAWLVWAHQAGAVLWLPSAAEQDGAWATIFGERAKAFAGGERHVDQMRELFVG